ncbi:MAG: hypothetical protein HYY94_02340, partial [Gemmatimonadetes bacterium]|nr:hypothetical protein [Gemmatimonadota bacterium]
GTVSGARPGLLVGRDGLEREYDDRLRGKDGERFLEVDALGRSVREAEMGQRLEPEQGESIRTTIDIDLQRYVAESFPEGMRGAVMVMDPATGEMLALYSSPAYDPNTFIGGVDPEVWSRLSQAADFPLLNRAIQARYPPASPWKLVVAAMAMHRGLVDLGSHMPIPCRGGLQYYNRYFRCWKLQGHGDLTLAEAIQYSCDVYFYQLGLKLQLTNLLADASRLGFRDRSGIDLPNEIRPLFPASTEYYNQRYGPRGWTNAVTLNLAIGQGENSQTLANMVAFYTMPCARRWSRWCSMARRQARGWRTCGSGARPARRRTRTARTTGGSSRSRRRTVPESWWGRWWNSRSTDRESRPW